MARINNRHQPSFSLFPVNNNRTGWQPVNIPLILFVPHRRTLSGFPTENTDITELEFFIEEAPGKVPVAGHEHIGVFHPDYERFKITISASQLADVKIDATGQIFYDSDGNQTSYDQAQDGNLMEYTMLRSPIGEFGKSGPGPKDTIAFHPDADYYDLSPFVIDVISLPSKRYNFVYRCRYHPRIISPNDELICIDTSKTVPARFASNINHPGEVHESMVGNTPALYFDSAEFSRDATATFYRPYADILQDIFDEQELLKGINWVDKIPAQYIPYLAYLIGLDMPYFPSSTDQIRRSLLKNGRRLQQLKGSQRAIRELFEIFGFTIDIANLWYSKDGTRFIAPNEQLPSNYEDQEITSSTICHAEPVLNSYTTAGFGQIEIPLLFRPRGNITIDAWLVESGSAADASLQSAVAATSANVEHFESSVCATTVDGFQLSTPLQDAIPDTDIIGHSTVLIGPKGIGINEIQVGTKSINQYGLTYDENRNIIKLNFDHYLGFNQNEVLYVFATYERTKIVLPADLADLRSNRFDINVLLFKDGQQPTSDIFDFLIEFLFRFKAFHSLLRKIAYTVTVEDIYNVTDLCVDGSFAQSSSSTLGNLQIPPPVIPRDVLDPDEEGFICDSNAFERGFKDSDTAYRSKILALLEEEHANWKRLDNTHQIPDALVPILQSATRLQLRFAEGENCQFTHFGQDRVVTADVDLDHNPDPRSKHCELDGVTDYCYKGRVSQEVEMDRNLILEEIFRCTPCALNFGRGDYYLTPLRTNNEFSGEDSGPNLTDVKFYNRSHHDRGYVRIMAFQDAEIHYNDRHLISNLDNFINNRFFATQKPSLEVVKDNLGIPGHRFVLMFNLETDFTSAYELRPWDYLYDIVCPENVPSNFIIPDLNAHLVENSIGDEVLVYDSYSLIYYGNGLPADIPQMDNHSTSAITPNSITHSIWSSSTAGLVWNVNSDRHYAIDQQEDGLRFPDEALGVARDTICFNELMSPIFESANRNCACPDDGYAAQSIEDIGTGSSSTSIAQNNGIPNFGRGGFGGMGSVTTTITVDMTTTTSEGADFIDGYPAEFGEFDVNLEDYDFQRSDNTDDSNAAIAVGLPLVGSDSIVALQFKADSGIRLDPDDYQYEYYRPYRMDCGCERYECDEELVGTGTGSGAAFETQGNGVPDFGIGGFGGLIEIDSTGTDFTSTTGTDVTGAEAPEINRCPLVHFQLEDGSYDWNCDRVIVTPRMLLDEAYGSYTILMDGTIPNMMAFDDDSMVFDTILSAFEAEFPREGRFQFIDEYGIIYVVIFETAGDKLDITTQSRDPRVWGEEPSGEVVNRRVYRDGIISNERQIIQVTDTGSIIIAEGVDQRVTRFQTTFGCGDEVYTDPFAYHMDANLIDDIDIIVTNVLTGSETNVE